FKESKKWLKKGLKGLEEEMKFQVYNDGVDYELSISYHRYVTELFLWAGYLCKINEQQSSNLTIKQLSPQFWEKLKKMVEFSKYYTKPNGLTPQIGDADDGRLHIVWEDFYHWDKENHFALFKLYNYVFSNKLRDPSALFRTTKSKSFSDSGFYIIRDKDFYLITGRNKCCYGKGGSHTHNDLLSFELSMFGNDFIVDPGTYVYTPDFKTRNRFRKTRAHNTVMIDNQEQNPIFKDPFYIEQAGGLSVNQWEIDNKVLERSEQVLILEAEHNCYERLRCPVIHNREFSFNKKERILYIKDKFKGKGDHELEWNFHFSSAVKVWVKEGKAEEKQIILIGNNGSLIFSAPKILNCVIIEDEISPSYGIKVLARTLRFTGFLKQGFPREYKFSFRPLK
ncbi:MAG TPA: alginate lyase family protein, partial [Candidatus Paceibacterota bacterium]|nr:alginate lyase family protein [Candidatus Paceibacterota bacterium]